MNTDLLLACDKSVQTQRLHSKSTVKQATAKPYALPSLPSLPSIPSFHSIERAVFTWTSAHAEMAMRFALAVVFIWFGALKVVGMSPAYGLVEKTVFWFSASWFVPALGLWEMIIGLGFVYRPLLRLSWWSLALHMPGTMLPFLILPGVCFNAFPFALTMEGQYIIKNLTIIAVAMYCSGQLLPSASTDKNEY